MIRIYRSFVLCAVAAGALEHAGGEKAVGDKKGVLPNLGSDKKFGKDYPLDARPSADILHFKHPYPVVQDSDDFDKDFVKDENSDDGSFKAQSEYDRLRHKLAGEKAGVAKALAARDSAEKELERAMQREKEQKAKVVKETKEREVHEDDTKEVTKVHHKVAEKAPPTPPSEVIAEKIAAVNGDIKIATQDTKQAMDALNECKKQLAEARESLKKLAKQLEGAKKVQRETQAVYDKSADEEKALEITDGDLKKQVADEYAEYMKSRESYLKQQALLSQMEAEIEVAAKNVKAIRDGEDKNGGIYNTPTKSAAQSSASLLCASVLMVFACMA